VFGEISLAFARIWSRWWRLFALALLSVPAVLVRLWVIHHAPEPDADAPGHLGIARALLSDPTNVAIHWVYLPAYHFLLAAFLLLGLNGDTIRLVNCVLAALVPFLVLRYGESTADREDGPSRYVPWMAATFCAVSPLVNLLGTSAQQETLFTLLVLGAVWSIDKGRFVVAGAILALASLVRYEAWGAVVLLIAFRAVGEVPSIMRRLSDRLARACRLPLVIAAPSVVAIGGWFLAHELREGAWFGFLRELYRYSHVQRDSLHRDLLWFPLEQPLYVFGSIVALLFFAGLRRAWRPSHVIPLGIYLFLVGAYLFKGALGSARYYESLTPFVALSAAHGACVVGARWRWIAPALFLAASLQLAALSVQLFLWTWPSDFSAHVAPATGAALAGVAEGSKNTASSSPPGTRLPAREARAGRR
jgi:hypothetical protein